MNFNRAVNSFMNRNIQKYFFISLVFFLFLFNLNVLNYISNKNNNKYENDKYSISNNETLQHDSIIFIGGYARSGTTLMRAILDVHQEVNCGPETKILPIILNFIKKTKQDRMLLNDLENAYINVSKIDEALAKFITHILKINGNDSNNDLNMRQCCKDPDILYHLAYLHQIFPNSKFIYMVRDGRGAAISLISRFKEILTQRSLNAYLNTWNNYNRLVNRECEIIGEKYCMRVRYEDLVLNTKETIKNVSKFLDLSWTDEFLHHEKYVGNKIKISKTEWSTEQIKQKIYIDSVKGWQSKLDNLALNLSRFTMLKQFGYV